MKFLAFSALATLAVASRAVQPRQAGTTVIPACATLTATAAPVSQTVIAAAVQGCVGVQALGSAPTRNDIVNKAPCKPYTLLFARGTSEDDLVGPPFVYALNQTLGTNNVAVQGVNNYPADVPGFCAGGSSTGSANLAQLIQQTQSQCPKTKLIVSGYSQGAQVVHNAFKLIPASAAKFVNAVVLFGDPDNGQALQNVNAYKVATDCHSGDNICQGGAQILLQHLNYCQDITQLASFVKARGTASD